MVKRILAFLLLVVMAVPAYAEEAAPVLVDRVNAPEAYADFAFADAAGRLPPDA